MNVKIARIRLGLTQQQLCKELGIGRSLLSHIENGRDAKVTKELMLKFAEVLGQDIDHLFFETN